MQPHKGTKRYHAYQLNPVGTLPAIPDVGHFDHTYDGGGHKITGISLHSYAFKDELNVGAIGAGCVKNLTISGTSEKLNKRSKDNFIFGGVNIVYVVPYGVERGNRYRPGCTCIWE